MQALDIARRQRARSHELRAAISVARILREQARYDEAHALLGGIYGWFTEGFETSDLTVARLLLGKGFPPQPADPVQAIEALPDGGVNRSLSPHGP